MALGLTKRSKTWPSKASNDDDDTSGISHTPSADSSQASGYSTPDNTRAARTRLDSIHTDIMDEVDHLHKKIIQKETSTHFWKSRRFLFPLGILFGILLGFILVQPTDISELQASLTLLLSEYDIQLPQIPELDLTRLESEWKKLRSNIPEIWKLNQDGREFMVGEQMKARGLSAKFPVVLVPGVISTGLESWSTAPEYRHFFRERVWGGFNMISQVTFNRETWIQTMMLDSLTGLDPPGVKVRAAEGIDAASSFIQGYWIWSKIVENLAVVNYDTNNLFLAPYDWRLSYWNLEERDGYFSRLKSTIESLKKRQKRKVVIAGHSMGSTVVLYFFKWVEHPDFGGGGPTWVEDHIETFISVAGTHLGVAKAMAAFLSGEMKDTVQLNPAGAYVLERFFSRKERQSLFRSWAGSASMWIKGGEAVWGNATHAPDDTPHHRHTHGELIAFRESLRPHNHTVSNMTAGAAGSWILQHTPTSFQLMMNTNYSYGIERDEERLNLNDDDHTKWTNPLESRLPNAPSMKILCVYGHGKETERSYWYQEGDHEYDEAFLDTVNDTCTGLNLPGGTCQPHRSLLDLPLTRRSWIDSEYSLDIPDTYPKVRNGVKMGEGDGTVSLLSLGAMCVEGWKRKRWNPAAINITTVELPHRPVPTMPRGGANTSDHVDILGSTGLNEIIVKVATGAGSEIQDNFVSNIQEYAKKIRWD